MNGTGNPTIAQAIFDTTDGKTHDEIKSIIASDHPTAEPMDLTVIDCLELHNDAEAIEFEDGSILLLSPDFGMDAFDSIFTMADAYEKAEMTPTEAWEACQTALSVALGDSFFAENMAEAIAILDHHHQPARIHKRISVPNDHSTEEREAIVRAECPQGYNWGSKTASIHWDGDFTIYKATFHRNDAELGQQAKGW